MTSKKLTNQQRKEKLLIARAKAQEWSRRTQSDTDEKKRLKSNSPNPRINKPSKGKSQFIPLQEEIKRRQALNLALQELLAKRAQLDATIYFLQQKIKNLNHYYSNEKNTRWNWQKRLSR